MALTDPVRRREEEPRANKQKDAAETPTATSTQWASSHSRVVRLEESPASLEPRSR